MPYLETLTEEIAAIVKAACPEVATVWPAEVIMRVPIDDLATNGRVPFAAVHYLGFQAGEWGLNNFAYEAEVEVLYVRKGPEDLDGLFNRLEAIRDAFEDEIASPTLTAGQVMRVGQFTFSANSPWNARFISKVLPYIGGSLVLGVLTGEGHGG